MDSNKNGQIEYREFIAATIRKTLFKDLVFDLETFEVINTKDINTKETNIEVSEFANNVDEDVNMDGDDENAVLKKQYFQFCKKTAVASTQNETIGSGLTGDRVSNKLSR